MSPAVLRKVGIGAAIIVAVLEPLIAVWRGLVLPVPILSAIALPFAIADRDQPFVAWIVLALTLTGFGLYTRVGWCLIFIVACSVIIERWQRL